MLDRFIWLLSGVIVGGLFFLLGHLLRLRYEEVEEAGKYTVLIELVEDDFTALEPVENCANTGEAIIKAVASAKNIRLGEAQKYLMEKPYSAWVLKGHSELADER